jgi:hypothetical protein
MTRSWYDDTIVRKRAVRKLSSSGDENLDWTNPLSLTITGCRLQALSAEELVTQRQGSKTTHRFLMPYGSDVKQFDRIIFDGVSYDVYIPPEANRSPFRGVQNTLAEVRRMS